MAAVREMEAPLPGRAARAGPELELDVRADAVSFAVSVFSSRRGGACRFGKLELG